jgi:hypothetical protein
MGRMRNALHGLAPLRASDNVADAASIRADAGSVGHDSDSYAGPYWYCRMAT